MFVWLSLTKAFDLPEAVNSRLIKISELSNDSISQDANNELTWGEEKEASITQSEAPCLTEEVVARSPNAKPNAPNKIDFPDPVSPVTTVNPLLKSRLSSSIRA